MQLTITFAMLMSVLSALAAPAPEAAEVEQLEKRTLNVHVCQNANWNGPCVDFHTNFNQCYPFSALGLSGYQSFGPDSGTTCLWYTGPACTGTQSDAVNFPGFAVVPGFWQSNTQSFKCWD
ncbi:hypothetical protein CPC08DRAFT_721232 [Agrocybe pediades]|nr:hypothetical protein CPC08DRAFT_721232 [Agrocybe pediades]